MHAKGNSSRPAEFNFHFDPAAAHIVLSSAQQQVGRTEPLVKLVPWETTLEHAFAWSFLDELAAGGGSVAQCLVAYTRAARDASAAAPNAGVYGRDSEVSRYAERMASFLLCDAYCMAPLLWSLVDGVAGAGVVESEDLHVQVELEGAKSRGSMLIDWFTRHRAERQDPGSSCRVLLKLDDNRIRDMFKAVFSN